LNKEDLMEKNAAQEEDAEDSDSIEGDRKY
jgi:hypothetical protein